ncbi:MAG TPA: M14 family zinc carboxypeptidase, partial [Tenuifilaceae bacterium]|nr:M14 family zinc carboxypeptidase [Tenuifilaceae bacterium]
MKRILYITILMLMANVGLGQIDVPLRFDKYYTYAETVEAVKALSKAYPTLAKTVLVGRSDEGREIWALEINNPKTGEALSKPGVYVDGNIHGNEIQAT